MRIYEQRVGDGIRIGDEIELRVLDIGDGRVRFGVEAPRDIRLKGLRTAEPSVNSASDRSAPTPDTKD